MTIADYIETDGSYPGATPDVPLDRSVWTAWWDSEQGITSGPFAWTDQEGGYVIRRAPGDWLDPVPGTEPRVLSERTVLPGPSGSLYELHGDTVPITTGAFSLALAMSGPLRVSMGYDDQDPQATPFGFLAWHTGTRLALHPGPGPTQNLGFLPNPADLEAASVVVVSCQDGQAVRYATSATDPDVVQVGLPVTFGATNRPDVPNGSDSLRLLRKNQRAGVVALSDVALSDDDILAWRAYLIRRWGR